MIQLYRVVSDAEVRDITKYGALRCLDGGMEVKAFWKTIDGYLHFLERARFYQFRPSYTALVVISLNIAAISWPHEVLELDLYPAIIFDAEGLERLNACCSWEIVDL